MNYLCAQHAQYYNDFCPYCGPAAVITSGTSTRKTYAHNESQEPKPCDHGNGICNPKNFPCNQFTKEPKALEEKHDREWCSKQVFRGKDTCDGTWRMDNFVGECPCKCHAKPQEEPEGGFGIDKAVEDLSGYIILPRPKGWRIGQTIWNFKEWLRLTHEVKDFFYMTDDEWNRRWNEYLTSIKSQE